MRELPIIVHLCVANQDSFLESAIRSVINHIDKIIVIEGFWKTSSKANGGVLRSTDNTIPILKSLQKEFGKEKIEIHHCNEETQLLQRSKYFEFYPYPHWLFLLDSDEIYEEEEIKKVIEATNRTDAEYFCTTSLTFVNDAYHYTPIDWPRLFKVEGAGYKFRSPNHLLKPDGQELTYCDKPIAQFYHYSYVMPQKRMCQKIADRIETHSEFKWEIQNGYVKRKGTSGKLLEINYVPEIVKNHPLLQYKAPPEAFQYKEPEKYGFLIHSGMGNLILATPMLKALRQWKPNARISVFTWERGVDVIRGWDVVNEVLTKDYAKFIHSIGGLDYLLLSPTAHIKDIGIFSQSKYVVELPPKKSGWVKHESEYNMDLVRTLGYGGETPSPGCYTALSIDSNERTAIVSLGYLRQDHWWLKSLADFNQWYSVIEYLIEKGFYIKFVGCKEDFDDVEKLSNKWPKNTINLCGKTTINELVAHIKAAQLFIGLDGGNAHIASCYRIPSVIVWTFTNLIKNLPLNPNLKLVALPCDKRLHCQHHVNECQHKNCRKITSDMIIKQLEIICKNKEC